MVCLRFCRTLCHGRPEKQLNRFVTSKATNYVAERLPFLDLLDTLDDLDAAQRIRLRRSYGPFIGNRRMIVSMVIELNW